MSENNLSRYYPLGLIGLILLFACLAVADSKEREQDAYRSYAASRSEGQPVEQFGTPRAGVPAAAEAFVSNPEPREGNDREKRDLAAQESMAVWAFWMAIAALCTLVVTTFGTFLIWRQVSLTREAVKDTENATNAMVIQNRLTELGNRAWLSVELTEFGPITYDAEGHWRITYGLSLTNHGNTPALGVASCSAIQRERNGRIDTEDFCKRAAEFRSSHVQAVAPNQTMPHRLMNLLLDCESLADDGKWPNGSSPYLLVGVSYYHPNSQEICYTLLQVLPCVNLAKPTAPITLQPRPAVMKTLMT